jgi:hypothetical protein
VINELHWLSSLQIVSDHTQNGRESILSKKLKNDSRIYGQVLNITLCNTVIYERQVWQKSILEGRSVVELKSNKASNELKLLYEEIFNGWVQ